MTDPSNPQSGSPAKPASGEADHGAVDRGRPKPGQRDPTQRLNKFRSLVGYTTQHWSEGHGAVELHLRDEHMNSMGIVHGGVYVTLLDAAFGLATSWCAREGHVRSAVTVSINTTYLSPARTSPVIARGRVTGQDGRMVTLQGEVVDADGTVCVIGQASFMYLPDGSAHRDGIKRAG